jgi:hypothetical protein
MAVSVAVSVRLPTADDVGIPSRHMTVFQEYGLPRLMHLGMSLTRPAAANVSRFRSRRTTLESKPSRNQRAHVKSHTALCTAHVSLCVCRFGKAHISHHSLLIPSTAHMEILRWQPHCNRLRRPSRVSKRLSRRRHLHTLHLAMAGNYDKHASSPRCADSSLERHRQISTTLCLARKKLNYARRL